MKNTLTVYRFDELAAKIIRSAKGKKNLGKKRFAFSKMDKNSVGNILKEIGL
jgi:hypothetical protein